MIREAARLKWRVQHIAGRASPHGIAQTISIGDDRVGISGGVVKINFRIGHQPAIGPGRGGVVIKAALGWRKRIRRLRAVAVAVIVILRFYDQCVRSNKRVEGEIINPEAGAVRGLERSTLLGSASENRRYAGSGND